MTARESHTYLNAVKMLAMARGSYHHGDLTNALLDAAQDLARERGAHGWSLREAAARTGVSPSAAYHHFDDREALIRALAGRALDALADEMEHAARRAEPQGADAQLLAIGRAYVRWARAEPALLEIAFGSPRTYPGTPVNPRPYDAVRRAAADAGLPAGAEAHLWAAVHGLATLTANGPLQGRSARASEQQAEDLVTVVLAGIRASAR